MPQWVAAEAMNYLKDRVNGHGGIILLDSHGRYGLAHNTPRLAWALQTASGIESGIQRT
jgi:beta-aspartyl-peptidase (threonine type)